MINLEHFRLKEVTFIMKTLISIEQAANLLGLSVTTLRRGVASGRFPHTRANLEGGKLLFDADLLQQVIQRELYASIKHTHRGFSEADEPVQPRSALADLFKTSEDPTEAQIQQDVAFGYEPSNNNASSSFI